MPGDTSRAWLDQYLATAQSGVRVSAALARAGGQGQRSGARLRFSRQSAGDRTEIVFDESVGAIVETRAMRDGRLHTLIERRFSEYHPGVRVLSSERVTRYPERASDAPRVMTFVYRNPRLLGGQ